MFQFMASNHRQGHLQFTARLFFLVAALIATSSGRNHVEAVNLALTPATSTDNTFDIAVSLSIFGDSDTATATGNVSIDLQHSIIDSKAVITEIEFTGGQIEFEDVEFMLGLAEVTGNGMAGTITTIISPSAVTGSTFNASDHHLTINQGTFENSIIPAPFDISTDPFEALGNGSGSIIMTETTRTPLEVDYSITVTLPVAFTGIVTQSGVSVDIELSGILAATGDWIVNLPFNGDFNGDLKTDAADYTIWRDTMGATGSGLAADANGDSTVNQADYDIWAADFGNVHTPTLPAVKGVPEPAILGEILLFTLAMAIHHGKRTNS